MRLTSIGEGLFRANFLPKLRIPMGLASMSLLEAALAYADCGWFVLPAHPNTKRPMGNEWQRRASRDPDQIRRWWAEDPRRGIALHVGRSGAVAFDLDKDSLADLPPEMAEALRSGTVQRSRSGATDRGHYLFAIGDNESFGDGAGAFAPYGEVKCAGVIIAQPTPHMKADQGGRYSWPASGRVPALPPALRECLRAAPEREAAPLTSRELEAFFETHTANDRPAALGWVVDKFVAEADVSAGIHEAMRDVLPWAFREAVAGLYPAREAYARLEAAWEAAFLRRSANANGSAGARERPAQNEFQELAEWAAAQAGLADRKETRARLSDAGSELPEFVRAALGPGGLWHSDTPHPGHNREHLRALELIDERKAAVSFLPVSAAILAEPVPPMEWLIRGVWPRNSFGPMGGEKKTLKTYNLLALSVAVASGKPLFDEFEVVAPGPVLYYVGEGGMRPFQRRLQAVARAYGADLRDLHDRFHAVFQVGSLASADFVDALRRNLDQLQPELVIVDPLYAFHPPGVEAQNLYERGRMLAELSGLVADEAALIVADHFKKNGAAGASGLDLDSIAQAGMGQWADSWILQRHREAPDLDAGAYRLEAEFGSRQWGGARYEIDWTLPAFGGLETGESQAPELSWRVRRSDGGDTASVRGSDRTREAIGQTLRDRPFELTKTALVDVVGGKKERTRAVIELMIGEGLILSQLGERSEGGRKVKRTLFGLRDPAQKLRPGRATAL